MWHDVKQFPFNAIGDFTADDTAAIQAALDAAAFGDDAATALPRPLRSRGTRGFG